MNAIVSIAGDYQQFDLDASGAVVGAGPRMVAKLEALAAVGLPADFVSGKSVLELGTDHGFFAFMSMTAGARSVLALDRNRVVKGLGHVDLVERNTELARRFPNCDRVQFRNVNLGNEWPEYGVFDVVFSMSVYHHVYAQCADHRAVWYWLARHTAPGGLLIWEGPTDSTDAVIIKNVPADLHAGYSHQALIEAAAQWFDIVSRGPALHEPTREVWICRRKGAPGERYHGIMVDGARGATVAFNREGGRRRTEIARALGVMPIAGSLNVVIDRPLDWYRGYYRTEIADSTDRRDPTAPWAKRWCRFYPVIVNDVGGWAMRFEGDDYDPRFVEVIGPHRFRDLIQGPEVMLCR